MNHFHKEKDLRKPVIQHKKSPIAMISIPTFILSFLGIKKTSLFGTHILLPQNTYITLLLLFYFLQFKDLFLPFLMTVLRNASTSKDSTWEALLKVTLSIKSIFWKNHYSLLCTHWPPTAAPPGIC